MCVSETCVCWGGGNMSCFYRVTLPKKKPTQTHSCSPNLPLSPYMSFLLFPHPVFPLCSLSSDSPIYPLWGVAPEVCGRAPSQQERRRSAPSRATAGPRRLNMERLGPGGERENHRAKPTPRIGSDKSVRSTARKKRGTRDENIAERVLASAGGQSGRVSSV